MVRVVRGEEEEESCINADLRNLFTTTLADLRNQLTKVS